MTTPRVRLRIPCIYGGQGEILVDAPALIQYNDACHVGLVLRLVADGQDPRQSFQGVTIEREEPAE